MQDNYILKKKLNRKIKLAIQYSKILQVVSTKTIKNIELILN